MTEENIELRAINFETSEYKGKVLTYSIPEIENKIDEISLTLEKNSIPEGLHQLDLYYANESKQGIDQVLIKGFGIHKAILEKIRAKLYSFLVENEFKLSQVVSDELIISGSETVLNKNVFIIHGHNEAKWRELEKMVRNDFGLNPIILGEQPDGGISTVIEKFEYYADKCSYAFALFTPDDIIESNGSKYFQARPNVIFELGWFVARLGKRNVCLILQDNQNTIQMFSDLQGVIQKRFQKNVSEIYRDIMLELRDVGMIN